MPTFDYRAVVFIRAENANEICPDEDYTSVVETLAFFKKLNWLEKSDYTMQITENQPRTSLKYYTPLSSLALLAYSLAG